MHDIQQILRYLPHRYPILLVDRILEVSEDGLRCKGLKNVTVNEPFFQGHYPGRPIMPGVLILESMAQVAAATLLIQPKYQGMVPLIGALDDIKFKRPVVPGDQLIVDCELLWVRGSIGRVKCQASVEGSIAAVMEMTFKLLDAESAAL